MASRRWTRLGLFGLALVFAPLASVPAAQAEYISTGDMEARMVAAVDLVEAMGAKQSILEQINRVIPLQMAQLSKQFPSMTLDSRKIIENSMRSEFSSGIDYLLVQIAATYARRFNVSEMKTMAAFNRSPAGTKLRAQSDDLQRELREISQRWGEDVARRVAQKLQEQLSKPAPLTS